MEKIKLFVLLVFAALNCEAQFRILCIGSDYKANEQALFLSHVSILRNDFYSVPPFAQRQGSVQFIPYTWANKLLCKEGSLVEGSTCRDSKVAQVADGSGIPYNLLLVLVKGQIGGGFPNYAYMIVNMKWGDDKHCGSILRHEFGHYFNFPDLGGGIMNATCNQGECGWDDTYTIEQTLLINDWLDAYHFNVDYSPPTISVLNAFVYGANTGYIEALASPDAMIVEIRLDGILQAQKVYWGTPDRGQCAYFNPVSGIKFWFDNMQSGAREIEIKAIDSNNNFSITTIILNVN